MVTSQRRMVGGHRHLGCASAAADAELFIPMLSGWRHGLEDFSTITIPSP